MAQVSIPHVAFQLLDPQPKSVAPSTLVDSPRLPPELYIDDEHHGRIYCPDCGVMCSRRPRKTPKRKDGVDAFFFHHPGFEEVECPHRKKAGGGGGDDEGGREKKAINLVTFAGWKSLSDDEVDDDFDENEPKKKKRQVEGGSSGVGNGIERYYDPQGGLLNPGEFRTVRRLVQLAKISLDIAIQFEGEEAIRLRDLIVSVDKVQKNIDRYFGKSFLFYGRPTSIVKGSFSRVFFNFQSPQNQLSGHCDLAIFEKRNWQIFERDRYYLFYGLIEGDESHSIVRIKEAGQIDRLSASAKDSIASLR
ncbi:hypothetical protein ACQ4OB_07890 [Pseudomonas sp. ES4]|uniref:hypothetical protein n=1 Tax=Pseudomonas sp. ES4 TaxID=3424777 RepID=UPI003D347F6C